MKRKKRPPNLCQFKWRFFEGVQGFFNEFFIFLEYRNTVLLRGTCEWSENNKAKSLSTLPKQTRPAGYCRARPANVRHLSSEPTSSKSFTETLDRTKSYWTMSEFWILAQWLDSWESSIYISTSPTTLFSWFLKFPVERVFLLHS
jgi:hypothetical protein